MSPNIHVHAHPSRLGLGIRRHSVYNRAPTYQCSVFTDNKEHISSPYIKHESSPFLLHVKCLYWQKHHIFYTNHLKTTCKHFLCRPSSKATLIDCWCHGYARRQGISSHDINLVYQAEMHLFLCKKRWFLFFIYQTYLRHTCNQVNTEVWWKKFFLFFFFYIHLSYLLLIIYRGHASELWLSVIMAVVSWPSVITALMLWLSITPLLTAWKHVYIKVPFSIPCRVARMPACWLKYSSTHLRQFWQFGAVRLQFSIKLPQPLDQQIVPHRQISANNKADNYISQTVMRQSMLV